ncbi:hypothetical protein [Capnocytophaga gingivalis]|jgi:hypothetical protein|uniref:hypothetical protein n=1 Tax=Capnocytophaga gingivalis TaxID=1017 RepID=UPI003C791CF2
MAKKDKDTIVERGKGTSLLGSIPNVTDGLKKIHEFQNIETGNSLDKNNANNASKENNLRKNYTINFRCKVSNLLRFNELHLQFFKDTKSNFYYYRANLFRMLLEEQKAIFEAEGHFVPAISKNIIANKGRRFKSIEEMKTVAFGGFRDDTRELLNDICYSFICLDNGEHIDEYSIDYFFGLILDHFCSRDIYKELVKKYKS